MKTICVLILLSSISVFAGPKILDDFEMEEMSELKKETFSDLTDSEKKRLYYLQDKYNWFRSNRYKYKSREELEKRWEKRAETIEKNNEKVKEGRDSMHPRSLQILLKKAKTAKERAEIIRIFNDPKTEAEKKMVREARNQSAREKRGNRKPKKKKKRWF